MFLKSDRKNINIETLCQRKCVARDEKEIYRCVPRSVVREILLDASRGRRLHDDIDRSIDRLFDIVAAIFAIFLRNFLRTRKEGRGESANLQSLSRHGLNWQIAFNRIAPRFPRSDFKTSSFLTFSPDLDLPLAGRTNVELYLLCSLFSNLSFRCSFYGTLNFIWDEKQ